jgi:hypothetical protein
MNQSGPFDYKEAGMGDSFGYLIKINAPDKIRLTYEPEFASLIA